MSSQCPVDSYYDKCVYKECKNERFLHGKRLFRFPMQKDTRCNTWIRNTGNTKLEKLSANTLRKLGICEDHFVMTSFTNATKIRLRKDAIPIAYENAGSNSANENVEVGEMQGDITETLSPNDENLIMEEQISEECTLQTYRPAALNFEISEKENTVENCMSANNVVAVDDVENDVDDADLVTELLDKHSDILEEYDVDINNHTMMATMMTAAATVSTVAMATATGPMTTATTVATATATAPTSAPMATTSAPTATASAPTTATATATAPTATASAPTATEPIVLTVSKD
ncbi:uncharacterized protein LOC112638648 [Camponotus floridanus]|uniref:uncharacterized protein LOC112638648 n=1 Tax=Camponotus floridanus TaxID=104421 RepID=UPI000DC6763A|nr:uncharacterized protein LOC112638648 [Camponotus floridanus]